MAREMKDSGIEWIGEIPQEWDLVKTKHCYSNQKVIVGENADEYERLALTLNGVIKRSKYDSTGLQPEVFTGYQILHKNELVFKLIDLENISTSRVGYSPYTGIVSPAYIVLHPDESKESRFGEYYFLSMWQREIFNHMGDDGVRSSLNAKDLMNTPYLNASSMEKERIVYYLDTQCAHIDSVIEKTRAAIEEYKKLKQAVITQAVTKGIRPNREMKDSGIEWIGEIPKEWKAILIIRLLDYSHPYPLGDGDHGLIKTESYQQTGIPYIRVQNLSWGQDLILDNLVYISEKDNNRIINSTLKPNDILFAKTGATIGKTGIVPNSIPVANTTSHIGKLTLSNTVNSKYVFYSLSSHVGYRQFWERACLKATRPELTIDEIRSIKVILPDSFTEQSEIVAYLDEKTTAIDSLIQKKEQLITELETYKKSLIFEYITGKKEVI